MRIVLAASELAPVAKTGGLGDVTAALGGQLAARGHDVRVFLPLYRRVREAIDRWETPPGLAAVPVQLGRHRLTFAVRRARLPGQDLVVECLDCPVLYDRPGIYTSDPDEALRFALLTRGVLAACQASAWAPDIVHANDWHLALAPLYLKLLSSWEGLFRGTRTVLTIHNLGYQGIFDAALVGDLGLDDALHLLHQEDLAGGRINFLKTGILYADVLTTVSRTYAREIQTPEHGFGLHELLAGRDDHLVGIVNGIDTDVWSPERDRMIPVNYSAATLDAKAGNTEALMRRVGLPPAGGRPVFGIVSRLVAQKGLQLLFEPLGEMLGHHDVRLVVLGSGEPSLQESFADLARSFPGRAAYARGYDDPLAHLIEAGSHFFLMPSLYEPCGLNQMYSLRYGTVPIVRRTGGLADTVELFDRRSGEGTGIVFDHFEVEAVRRALIYALELYADRAAYRRCVLNGMARDFSWSRQAGLYEDLYHRLLGLPAGRR